MGLFAEKWEGKGRSREGEDLDFATESLRCLQNRMTVETPKWRHHTVLRRCILELTGKGWTGDVNLGVVSTLMALKAVCKLSN